MLMRNSFYFIASSIILLSACSKTDSFFKEEEDNKTTEDSNTEKNDDEKEAYLLSQDYVIAHRGVWNKEDAPENSRNSFIKALAMRIYGVEFDVRQTKDGKLVIYHDAVFKDMSIENSTYEELCTSKLSNGETVPLLEDYLYIRKYTETTVKLIIDIKSCTITDLVSMIDEFDLQNDVIYITFTKSYCQQLTAFGFGKNTYYSSNNITPTEIKGLGFGGVCYKYTLLDSKPGVLDEANSLNIKIMAWTVNDADIIRDYSTKGVYVITDNPEEF